MVAPENSLINLKAQLSDMNRRRQNLESDLSTLERKIEIIDNKIKSGDGNQKFISLKDYFENEKKKIILSKLNRIDLKTKSLELKIRNLQGGKEYYNPSKQTLNSNKSSSVFKESIFRSVRSVPKRTSEPFPVKSFVLSERKYQSLPITRPHTAIDTSKYCSFCIENYMHNRPSNSLSKKFSEPSINSNPYEEGSTKHIVALCSSFDFWKDRDLKVYHIAKNEKPDSSCVISDLTKNEEVDNILKSLPEAPSTELSEESANSQTSSPISNISDFLTPYSNEFQIKNFCMSCNTTIHEQSENGHDNLQQMLNTYDSVGLCPECTRAMSQPVDIITSISDRVIGASQKFAVIPNNEEIASLEELEDVKSISPSILATCDSFAHCECCNHNMQKISLPTPSPSIVALGCTSHTNCRQCAEALAQSQRQSFEDHIDSHNDLKTKSSEDLGSHRELKSRSFVNFKPPSQRPSSSSYQRLKLQAEIHKEIQFQIQVVSEIEDQISEIIREQNGSKQGINNLRHSLEIENMKLQDMVKLAKIEERRSSLMGLT